LTIDGTAFTSITQTDTSYSCKIGTWTAGSHTYLIQDTNIHGATTSYTGTFDVVNPPPPTIANIVIVESQAPKNNVLESNERLVIKWTTTCTLSIISQSLIVDGTELWPINGSYRSYNHSYQLGKRKIGTHTYTITSTDSMGDTSIVSGTFTVAAPIPPSITNVAVVEVGTTTTDNLDPGKPLKNYLVGVKPAWRRHTGS